MLRALSREGGTSRGSVAAGQPRLLARQNGGHAGIRTRNLLFVGQVLFAIEPRAQKMVGVAGFEPAYTGTKTPRLWPLVDTPEDGRADWIRTSDPLNPIQVRYQTSLQPVRWWALSGFAPARLITSSALLSTAPIDGESSGNRTRALSALQADAFPAWLWTRRWLGREESNFRLRGQNPSSCHLTTPQKMVGLGGIEPPCNRLPFRLDISQRGYRPEDGDSQGTRTL